LDKDETTAKAMEKLEKELEQFKKKAADHETLLKQSKQMNTAYMVRNLSLLSLFFFSFPFLFFSPALFLLIYVKYEISKSWIS